VLCPSGSILIGGVSHVPSSRAFASAVPSRVRGAERALHQWARTQARAQDRRYQLASRLGGSRVQPGLRCVAALLSWSSASAVRIPLDLCCVVVRASGSILSRAVSRVPDSRAFGSAVPSKGRGAQRGSGGPRSDAERSRVPRQRMRPRGGLAHAARSSCTMGRWCRPSRYDTRSSRRGRSAGAARAAGGTPSIDAVVSFAALAAKGSTLPAS
jgi:hypothetical protein